jgi:hypothetical protein
MNTEFSKISPRWSDKHLEAQAPMRQGDLLDYDRKTDAMFAVLHAQLSPYAILDNPPVLRKFAFSSGDIHLLNYTKYSLCFNDLKHLNVDSVDQCKYNRTAFESCNIIAYEVPHDGCICLEIFNTSNSTFSRKFFEPKSNCFLEKVSSNESPCEYFEELFAMQPCNIGDGLPFDLKSNGHFLPEAILHANPKVLNYPNCPYTLCNFTDQEISIDLVLNLRFNQRKVICLESKPGTISEKLQIMAYRLHFHPNIIVVDITEQGNLKLRNSCELEFHQILKVNEGWKKVSQRQVDYLAAQTRDKEAERMLPSSISQHTHFSALFQALPPHAKIAKEPSMEEIEASSMKFFILNYTGFVVSTEHAIKFLNKFTFEPNCLAAFYLVIYCIEDALDHICIDFKRENNPSIARIFIKDGEIISASDAYQGIEQLYAINPITQDPSILTEERYTKAEGYALEIFGAKLNAAPTIMHYSGGYTLVNHTPFNIALNYWKNLTINEKMAGQLSWANSALIFQDEERRLIHGLEIADKKPAKTLFTLVPEWGKASALKINEIRRNVFFYAVWLPATSDESSAICELPREILGLIGNFYI